MGKKSSSAGSAVIIGLAIIFAAIAAIPKEIWVLVGIVISAYLILKMISPNKPSSKISTAELPAPARTSGCGTSDASAASIRSGNDEPVPVFDLKRSLDESFRIQKPKQNIQTHTSDRGASDDTVTARMRQDDFASTHTSGRGVSDASAAYIRSSNDNPVPIFEPQRSHVESFRIQEPKPNARWVPPSETVQVGNFTLPGGMLYVGSGLRSSNGSIEPALINPKLAVAQNAVYESLHLTGYWPSYEGIQPEARRSYLQWLAGGRNNPDTNIGYVFLFFYGLERRALIDTKNDSGAHAEIHLIEAEVKRLLSLYGANGSFRGYATNFLEFLEASKQTSNDLLYQQPPPRVESSYELPLRIRLGLGQMAANKVPVPALWAHAWVLADPNIIRRTPATRCSEMFEILFNTKYSEKCGEGMRLTVNRTRLKYAYRAASSGMAGHIFSLELGEIPDVSATTIPIKNLQSLVDECTSELEGYSRFIGRNPGSEHSLDALLQLPISLWPAPVRAEIDSLRSQIGDGLLVVSFGELSGRLKSAGELTRDKTLGLARALESLQIGIEPDVLGGAKTPKPEDSVVLFATHQEDGSVRSSPAYQAAAVTIGLSHAVAEADGDVSAPELLHLSHQIDSWTHLSAAHRKRLKAYLRLQISQPTPLAIFKNKLEILTDEARRSIAHFLASLAQADGVVAPEEVKLLEKIYKNIGVDTKLLYSDLHVAATPITTFESMPTLPPQEISEARSTPTLNAARIAALQKETDQVSSLLASVFADAEPETTTSSIATQEETAEQKQNLLGLDAEHSAFLRLLLTRPSWLRQELSDVASDMELMLDGALECINEVFFDKFDEALTDGEDPVEVNQHLLETQPI